MHLAKESHVADNVLMKDSPIFKKASDWGGKTEKRGRERERES